VAGQRLLRRADHWLPDRQHRLDRDIGEQTRNSQKDQTIKIVTATNHNHKADSDLARRYIRYTQESEDDFEIWRPFCTLSERWHGVAHRGLPRGKRNLNRAVRLSLRLGYLAGSIKRMV
jgi:hypothetical protein